MKKNSLKEKFFDAGLYAEGLRQIKTMGIVFLVILVVSAAFIPAITVWDSLQGSVGAVYRLYEIFPFLLASVFIFSPVMTLRLFRFLNTRNQSDFYHSLPYSRSCIYVSFSAAVMTHTMAGIIISVLFEASVCALSGNIIILSISSVWPYVLAVICGSFLSMAAALIAVSVTGTTFSNVVLGMLILYFPRAVVTIMTTAVTNTSGILVYGRSFGLLKNSYNIPAGLVMNLFTWLFGNMSSGDVITALTSYTSSAYTFILGAIYFVIGSGLFIKRRSETASQTASGRLLQAGLRICVSMVVCIFGCLLIYMRSFGGYGYSPVFIFIIFFVGVIVYFLYELVSTRKPKNLAKIFPGLVVLAVLNVIMIFGMRGMYKSQMSFQPEAEEITSISVTVSYNSTNYLTAKRSEAYITDETAKEIVSCALKETIENGGASGNTSSLGESGRWQVVVIRTEKRSEYRNIYFTAEEYALLTGCLESCDEIKTTYTQLPDISAVSLIYLSAADLSSEEGENLYECAVSEIGALDFDEAYELFTDQTYLDEDGYYAQNMDTICATITEGADIYYIYIPIIPGAMPKTCAMYAQYVNSSNAEIFDVLCAYAEMLIQSEEDITVSFLGQTYTGSGIELEYCWVYLESVYFKGVGLWADIDSEVNMRLLLEFLENYEEKGQEYAVIDLSGYVVGSDKDQYRYVLRFDSANVSEGFLESFAQ